MLLDLGAPEQAPQPSRRALRRQVIAQQEGRCANQQCRREPKSLDVVRQGDGTLVAFCRPCRLRWDAPARAEKARETRALGVQLRIPGTNRRLRRARRVMLPSARTLVEEAMGGLGTDMASVTIKDGAWALVEVLRRRGVVFDDGEATGA